ncbi:hypothetical protein EMIT091MI3_150063 [Kosakonia quasisacchari]
MTIQRFFASLSTLELLSMVFSVTVSILFILWIIFGFRKK